MIVLMRNKDSYPSFYRTDEELKLIWICSIFYFLTVDEHFSLQ